MILQIIVYTIIAVFIGISQSAGIGGGPILNICLMMGLGYEAKDSMSITYIFLMGGALASIWKSKNKINKKTGGPIIDSNLIMLTLPSSVSGSLFGTILNHFISDFIITILFSVLLSYLAFNSYQKLKALKRIENPQNLKQPLIEQIELKNIIDNQNFSTTQSSVRLKEILEEQKSPFPKQKIKIVSQILIITIVVLLCKGGQTYSSIIGIQSCGYGSWFFILLHLVLCYLYTKSVAIQQYKLDVEKQSLGYVFENPLDKMSQNKMNSCMFFGFMAGVVGGALGLGGAIILVPVWLNKGIDKQVAVNSSPPLIFVSAFISFTVALLASKYSSFSQVLFYLLLAIVGSYAVKEIVTYISQKYNLKQMIFILLIITMVSSLVTLIPFQFNNFISDPVEFMQFGVLC